MRNLDGKRVLITGGSSGIGLATARAAARRGAHVGIVARNVARLEQARRSILSCAKAERRVDVWSLDVSDATETQRWAPVGLADLGGLDLLVCNAGISIPAAARDTPLAAYQDMMNVNFFGTMHVTRAFMPHLVEQGSGHIAAVSSVAGFLGVYGFTAYCASKHAVTGYMESLRQELMLHDVGCSILFPGDTDTPMLHAENENKPEGTWAVAGLMPVMSAEQVAEAFLEGIQRGKFHIVPGLPGRATYAVHHHVPQVLRLVVNRVLRRLGPERAPKVRSCASA